MKNYLEKYFPVYFTLKEKPHIVSICEYETSNINDKGALEVGVGGFWSDAFRWLTIDGFHYYFPGLIRNSLVDLDSSLCVIEQNWADLVESDDYRKTFSIDEKWNGFSLLQLEYFEYLPDLSIVPADGLNKRDRFRFYHLPETDIPMNVSDERT